MVSLEKGFYEKCNFSDIRNSWETKDAIKIDGSWCSIQCELIKQAAKCRNYASDIVIDINGIDKKIHKGEEFETHLFFYDCGVHSTLEYSGNEWTEEQKCEELKKHCDGLFAEFKIQFSKVDTRDYELICEEIRG